MDHSLTPKKNAKARPAGDLRDSSHRSGADMRQPGDSWCDRKTILDVGHLSSARCRTSMSTRTTKFLTDWLRWHVVGRVASAEDIPALAAKCLHDAWREGISRYDIEGAVGPLEDCIREGLLQVKR